MLYIVEIADLQLIGRFGSMKREGLFALVIYNGHGELLSITGERIHAVSVQARLIWGASRRNSHAQKAPCFQQGLN